MNTDFIYVLWNERTTGIVSDGHCYEPFEKKPKYYHTMWMHDENNLSI